MARIRPKNTRPELFLRSILHKKGFRFRLHRKDLPGRPDIVLPKYKTVIFIHGCFWHQHKKCRDGTLPKTRQTWWLEKFKKNIDRDKLNVVKLTRMQWKVIVVWECEIEKSLENVANQICKKINLEK